MQLFKAVFRNEFVRIFLCWLGACYIRLVFYSSRWQVIGAEHPASLWNAGKPFILAFWHGRILLMPFCWNRRFPINMLISSHRDGQLIARTVGHFDIKTLFGSSSRGGMSALRAMVKSLKAGESVGITPDGPRGPPMRSSDGIASLARMSGIPVIPCSYSVARRHILGSWDSFLIACPFTRGVFIWGEPIIASRDDDVEKLRLMIEKSLNMITADADRRMGHES